MGWRLFFLDCLILMYVLKTLWLLLVLRIHTCSFPMRLFPAGRFREEERLVVTSLVFISLQGKEDNTVDITSIIAKLSH